MDRSVAPGLLRYTFGPIRSIGGNRRGPVEALEQFLVSGLSGGVSVGFEMLLRNR